MFYTLGHYPFLSSKKDCQINKIKNSQFLFLTGNAIDNMGSSTPRPVEGTPLPPPRPSPQVQRDDLNINLLPEPNAVSSEHISQNTTQSNSSSCNAIST